MVIPCSTKTNATVLVTHRSAGQLGPRLLEGTFDDKQYEGKPENTVGGQHPVVDGEDYLQVKNTRGQKLVDMSLRECSSACCHLSNKMTDE